jgi:N-acetylmuramoyl-L-alanine amidase
VDGKFGAKTYNALRMFQSGAGLDPDGVCGPKTWDALGTENKPSGSVSNEPDNVPDEITNALAEARKRLYEAIAIINGIMEGDDDG